MRKFTILIIISILLTGCTAANTAARPVPAFEHIVIVFLENKDTIDTIGSDLMPNLNQYTKEYTYLSNYYAVSHPSLSNYLALVGGDTFGVTKNCNDCFVNATNLADLIEKSGRTWKTYQEDMPAPCFLGDADPLYKQKHNPFVYFDSIRTDKARCERSVVPLTQLDADISNGELPNFVFITPNMCNSGHDCRLDIVDHWLGDLTAKLKSALDATGKPYLLVLTYDEGDTDFHLTDLFRPNGGNVPAILISPQAKNPFTDDTFYTHYSLLKTIADAWGLDYIGQAANNNVTNISAPWK